MFIPCVNVNFSQVASDYGRHRNDEGLEARRLEGPAQGQDRRGHAPERLAIHPEAHQRPQARAGADARGGGQVLR